MYELHADSQMRELSTLASILPVTPKRAMSKVSSYRADIPIIAVLGPTGVGKSFFIRKATGNADVKIGHGLESGKSDLR